MSNSLPPGQLETTKWPILHEGDVYAFDEQTWRFNLFGDIHEKRSITYKQMMELPTVQTTTDLHCVTTWSKFDITFEGIPFRELLTLTKVNPEAKYIRIYGYLDGDPRGYSANLPLADLQGNDALFVTRWKDATHDWADISPKHGYPLRFVPPKHFYFWKGSKWATAIEFMQEDLPGFWEVRGYHMHANPFKEQRFSGETPSGLDGADEWR